MKGREIQTVMTHKWKWQTPRLAKCTDDEWIGCMINYEDDTGPKETHNGDD